MKRCSSCGTYAEDNAYVCPRCGAPLGAPQQAPQYARQVTASQRQAYNQPAPACCERNNIVAGIFALLFGYLGIHYFYMGKIGGGFICILLELVTCGVWSIVTFIQGIVFMCMSNEDFNRKFVQTSSTFPVF